MLRRHSNNVKPQTIGLSRNNTSLKSSSHINSSNLDFFHFTLSEKNHEIILPVEEETAWEQMHDITWDPARGD